MNGGLVWDKQGRGRGASGWCSEGVRHKEEAWEGKTELMAGASAGGVGRERWGMGNRGAVFQKVFFLDRRCYEGTARVGTVGGCYGNGADAGAGGTGRTGLARETVRGVLGAPYVLRLAGALHSAVRLAPRHALSNKPIRQRPGCSLCDGTPTPVSPHSSPPPGVPGHPGAVHAPVHGRRRPAAGLHRHLHRQRAVRIPPPHPIRSGGGAALVRGLAQRIATLLNRISLLQLWAC